MSSPITLQAIIPSTDAQTIGHLNSNAFLTDAHWKHQWGLTPPEQIITDTATRTASSLISNRHSLRYLKAVDTSTNIIVGYARWILPDSLEGEDCWPEALIPAPSKHEEAEWTAAKLTTLDTNGKSRGLNWEMVRALGGMARGDRNTRAKYGGEWLELDYLAVHTEYQGRGIGTMLVKKGIEKAKELGVNLIIMGFTGAGRKLYDGMVGKGELRKEEVVMQSCERWEEGRGDGCECVAGFYAWLVKEQGR